MVGGDVLQRAVGLHQRERAPVVCQRVGDLVHDPAQRLDLIGSGVVEPHPGNLGEDALAPLCFGEPRSVLPLDASHGSGSERYGRLFATFPQIGRRAAGLAVWYVARPMASITPQIVAAHGLSQDEYARIRKVLGRDPNIVELGVFSAMWSEHCSYKSSRRLLRHLPTKGRRVLQGPGEIAFDPSFNGNCLVNAFTLGLLKSNRIFRGTASGAGNPVIYIGARTGRDGIHGATMASAEFDEESESKRPTVQVGDPFMEKL